MAKDTVKNDGAKKGGKTATQNAKQKPTMHDTRIDVEADNRRAICELLNGQLADTSDLYSQAKQAHWNVKGMNFFQLHTLFDAVAAAVEPFVDELAERITALGGEAMGTVRMAAQNTTLPEFPQDATTGEEMVRVVADRFAAYAASTREGIRRCEDMNEPTTADLLTEISRVVDKQLYFLEAHLQG